MKTTDGRYIIQRMYSSKKIHCSLYNAFFRSDFFIWRAHEESNLDQGIRNPPFYPLNYERVVSAFF